MDFHFFSFVGTQIMGVLNVLEGCLQNADKKNDIHITKIHLAATDQTMKKAEFIRQQCEQKGCPPVNLIRYDASTAGIHALLKGLPGPILFNIDGGLNFSVAAAAAALANTDTVLATASSEEILLFNTGKNTVQAIPLPKPLPVNDLLQEQGVEWEASEDNGFCERCRSLGIRLPGNRLENIRISGQHFDLVWNDAANRLHFLTTLFTFIKDPKERLAQVRNLINWASTRTQSQQMYDRTVYALCGWPLTAEQLNMESHGKLKAYFCSKDCSNKNLLEELFGQVRSTPPAAKGSRKITPSTLVLALGADPMPTLNAMRSHKLANVLVCHTGDERMQSMARRLRELHPEAKTFETDLHGTKLPLQLKLGEEAENVQVNITPGTKGQAAFLALWAARNNVPVYSLDKDAAKRLDKKGSPIPIHACDPMDRLRIEFGGSVHAEPCSPKNEFCEALLRHMQGCLKSGGEWSFRRPAHYDGISLARPGGKISRLSEGKRLIAERSEEGGGWLEELAAYALIKAGGHDVWRNITLDWSEEAQKQMRKKYAEVKHRLEMDVMGAWKWGHVMISCKSYADTSGLDKTAKEARNVSSTIARFARPIVCHMGCQNYDLSVDGKDKILVIGWKALCQPDELARLLDEYLGFESTTQNTNPQQR